MVLLCAVLMVHCVLLYAVLIVHCMECIQVLSACSWQATHLTRHVLVCDSTLCPYYSARFATA